jgi:hypothetical protein
MTVGFVEVVLMKRSQLAFSISIALLSVAVTQLGVRAATIDMSITTTTEDGTTIYEAPCPVYETTRNGREVWKIGWYEGDQTYTWNTPEGRVTLGGFLDPDPQILFSGPVIDFGAPSNFSFVFTLPLAPQVNNPSIVRDSFSGSVTNAAGGGVTVTALPPPAGIPVDGDGITEVEVYTLSDDGGVTWKNVGLDLMPTTVVPLAVGGSGSTGAFNEGPIATIPGGPWTHMRADVNFSLTGGGDIFTFNGSKILVPEPGTFVLSLFAAMAACAGGRRVAR